MAYQDRHPEQDPAEGSPETIDRELARHGVLDKPADSKRVAPAPSEPVKKPAGQDHRPM